MLNKQSTDQFKKQTGYSLPQERIAEVQRINEEKVFTSVYKKYFLIKIRLKLS